MKSMTGFGRGSAECSEKGIGFEVEVSAVNRKQLEIRPSLPRELGSYEPLLRSLVADRINRGSINVRVNLVMGEAADANTRINHRMVNKLTQECEKIAEESSIKVSLDLGALLSVPGVVENEAPDMQDSELLLTFKSAISKALDSLLMMRRTEGESLKKDLTQRLTLFKENVEKLEPLTLALPEQQKERLIARINEAQLEGVASDDERILREIVIFTDRCDVSEEMTRLRSHCSQMDIYLHEKSGPVGRSLDFLLQEMFREVNTLGNKAASCEVSPIIVVLKTELEKMREQVQNVE